MGYFERTGLEDLVGRQVEGVLWSEHTIVFETDEGNFAYGVEGDCCSHSYFHDLIGLDKLLDGPVVSVNSIDLSVEDNPNRYEEIQAYGYQIVTDHPMWGEVTTALSFRNASNGYYGGWLYKIDSDVNTSNLKRLTKDVVGS